jgi:hypothetical protein
MGKNSGSGIRDVYPGSATLKIVHHFAAFLEKMDPNPDPNPNPLPDPDP